ncbi:dirigent protein 23-like [Macadamia integrifolia]|uniref:dirigent protein 23-like n=1 Tax=Macadamia integrifolia TaxID=60698 RepID=UPI001C4EA464|nr:dirigent protein 23-like [Macadamia integrifolia]
MAMLFLFLVFPVVVSSSTSEAQKQNVTNIQFYMHDVVGGSNPTAVRVASRSANVTGLESSDPIAAMFGSTFVMDNPLTVTPDPNSTLIGRAQGIYAMASQKDEFSLLMTLTYGFTTGQYNGSSFSVIGRNPVMRKVREMPIVGGTGIFRFARGYCSAQTHSTSGMDAVIGYNVTILMH